MDVQGILWGPHITEKASQDSGDFKQVVFKVDPKANKHHIRLAVEEIYGVQVRKVRTGIMPGKTKRRGKLKIKHSHWKKAWVTLEHGETIDFFAAE